MYMMHDELLLYAVHNPLYLPDRPDIGIGDTDEEFLALSLR